MSSKHISAAGAAFFLFATSALAASPSSYDGVWNVTTTTRTGGCAPSAHYPLIVSDGAVAGPPEVSGTVSRTGNVKVFLKGAFANGTLSGNSGSGKWNGASASVPCSGHWEASRQ